MDAQYVKLGPAFLFLDYFSLEMLRTDSLEILHSAWLNKHNIKQKLDFYFFITSIFTKLQGKHQGVEILFKS